MGDKSDQVKGRVEEAVGALTDDKDLKREGRKDRIAGEAKEKLEHAKDKLGDAIDTTKDKIGDAIDKTKDSTRRK
ncbi:MAG TPA: CsbD family protein [Gaiellaceae bacterium]|nr:CsbD family protein [Gaiellaceae bacterium]